MFWLIIGCCEFGAGRKNVFNSVFSYALMEEPGKSRGIRRKNLKMGKEINYNKWCIAISQKAEMRCTIFLS